MGFEDFARYIIGTNSDSFDWSSKRLMKSRPTVLDRYKNFMKSLDEDKKIAWNTFQYYLNTKKPPVNSTNGGIFTITIENKFSSRTISKYERIFLNSLNQNESKIYNNYVVPYLQNPQKYKVEDKKFNLAFAQLWILKRVFDLGWTEKRFGDFDSSMIFLNNRKYIRAANKPERIGKKYQWIAYYEFLARVSDNFKLKKEYWDSQSPSKYEGPWQKTYLRNIDPSFLSTKTESSNWASEESKENWWFTERYTKREQNETDEQWISHFADLPDVKSLIEVTNPKDNSVWLNLNGSFQWYQPKDSDKDSQKMKRQLFYVIHGYLVKNQDSEKAFRWAQKQNFIGRWMPDPWDFHHIFLGEFVWSPAYINTTSNGYSDWTTEPQYNQNNIPCPIHSPCMKYHWSSGEYDCSIEDGITISIPSALLIKKMDLSWNGKAGK
jgi:hypothetical protein